MKLENTWLEVPLSAVLQYYADGYDTEGKRIVRREYFVDTAKNVALFKIVTEES